MKSHKFRIGGVYNEPIVSSLLNHSVSQLSFDLRPRSLNFIQEYVLLDLVKNFRNDFSKFYLTFSIEKDFIISKIIEDLSTLYGDRKLIKDRIMLEFVNDSDDIDFYDQFGVSYCVEIDNRRRLERLSKAKYLREIIISQRTIEYYQGRNEEHQFLRDIFRIAREKSYEVTIQVDWNFDFAPSLFDFFQFDQILINLGPEVESSYRNFSGESFTKSFSVISNQLINL